MAFAAGVGVWAVAGRIAAAAASGCRSPSLGSTPAVVAAAAAAAPAKGRKTNNAERIPNYLFHHETFSCFI